MSMKNAAFAGLGSTMIAIAAFAVSAADRVGAVSFDAPSGITLVDVTNGSDQFLWRRLGDATGKPLYAYGKDANSGKATCVDDCAREFPPFLAQDNAVAMGDWSLVSRDGKAKQWAYQGRALYRYSGADPSNDGATRRGRGGSEEALADPGSKLNSPKDGWKRVAFAPADTIPVPAGIALRSLAVAGGYGFVVQNTGMTMYVMKTAPKSPDAWRPVYAPGLARPLGDFTIRQREDGKRQWAYKEQLLYTFNEDYSPSDLSGVLAQKDAQPALAYRHFMPDAMHVETLPARGPMLVTDKGLSLYTQSRYRLQYGGREIREGYRYSYADAKAVGPRGCVDECTKTWRPLVAPARAQASGFWEIETRPDGMRQWSYKGSPLYTYVGDKKPGDIEGNNQHVIVYGDPEGKVDLSLTGGDRADARGSAGSGFYWHLVGLFN
jgi:predicted lipoprotein with Yx(FWY)xxD motif